MVYIWAVEALGKGPSEPKTTEVCALFDVYCEKCKIVIQKQRRLLTNVCVSPLPLTLRLALGIEEYAYQRKSTGFITKSGKTVYISTRVVSTYIVLHSVRKF